jgi:hypothetical protein
VFSFFVPWEKILRPDFIGCVAVLLWYDCLKGGIIQYNAHSNDAEFGCYESDLCDSNQGCIRSANPVAKHFLNGSPVLAVVIASSQNQHL